MIILQTIEMIICSKHKCDQILINPEDSSGLIRISVKNFGKKEVFLFLREEDNLEYVKSIVDSTMRIIQ